MEKVLRITSDDEKENTLGEASIIIIVVILAIALIVITAIFIHDVVNLSLTLLFGILFLLIILFLGFGLPNILKERKKKDIRKYVHQQNTERKELTLAGVLCNFDLTDSDRVVVIKKSIPSTIFSKSDEKKMCGICKLEIRPGQEVFQCTFCLWHFHIDHLAIWLIDRNDCPICAKNLDLYS